MGLRAEVRELEQEAHLMVARVRRGEERVGTLEHMTGRSFIESALAVAELNEDAERLYEKLFGAGCLWRRGCHRMGGGWHKEQELNRFLLSDDGKPWRECSRSIDKGAAIQMREPHSGNAA